MSPYISAFENLPNDEDRPATLAYSERAWGLAPRPNIGPCQRCSGIHPVPSTSIVSSHLPVNSQHPLFSKSADILKSTAADLHHSRYITVYDIHCMCKYFLLFICIIRKQLFQNKINVYPSQWWEARQLQLLAHIGHLFFTPNISVTFVIYC